MPEPKDMATTEIPFTPDEELRAHATPPTVPDVSPLCIAPSVTAETITDDELCALRDEAIESGDDGTRNIACGALNAVDEFQGFACRQACAAVLNAKRSGRP